MPYNFRWFSHNYKPLELEGIMQINPLTILCFILAAVSASNPALLSGDHISINCGSTAPSKALNGREWLGDVFPKFSSSITVKGSSLRSSVDPELMISVDPVPYKTARVSRSQFAYNFQLNPGQKFIRLHFNPTSYNGFQRFNDLCTVEAGPFTLLANFSASITADALAVSTFAKEFCIIIQENQPLNIVFTPSASYSQYTYAFINGIEIISVPSNLNYCHGGDVGVQVVGRKSVIYVDNNTALELVHRQNIKWGSVLTSDDITGMFGMWATIVKEKINNAANTTWRIAVDVGFRYLVRIHFCELGLRMLEATHNDFILLINQMVVSSSADILQERGNRSMLWYKNYMVMVEGHKQEGKRDILISLESHHVFLDIHGPLEGFEVFKLSNHDNSLASPNPLPPMRVSQFPTTRILLSLIGRRNAIATIVCAVICLANIIAHMLQKIWGVEFSEEENSPPARAKRVCRHFSLAEIISATDDFHDAFVIGKGGFGKVYKGIIDNGQETVAIKRLKPDSKQGKREFWTEIEMLSELRHMNLVPLIGYCSEQKEMILVYEYMPRGTLADHLYKFARKNRDHHPLSWKQLLKICIGAGRGLDFLHTGHGVIHRDVKASNILLDERFVAKVADFGLAKIGSVSESQSEASTNLKGTFGYMDPDYFRTHKLTTKSDIYSFGVVLLEVLCGRPAVEPWAEEDKRSLTMWARDNISKGQVDQIVAPILRKEISPASLKTFLRIVEKCLLDEPKKRPSIAHVVIKLEFALEKQEQSKSLALKERASVADLFSSVDKSPEENMNSLIPNERTNVADISPQKENGRSPAPNGGTNLTDAYTDKSQHERANFLSPIEEIGAANALPDDDRTILSLSTRLTAASSNVQNITSFLREKTNSDMINSGKRDDRKSMMHKLSRKLWPWDALRKVGKSSKKKDLISHAQSAPIQHRTSYMASKGSSILPNSKFSAASRSNKASPSPAGQVLSQPDLRIFSLLELKAATRNFRSDTVLGKGGFGVVYMGRLDEKSSDGSGSGTLVAVKRLNPESLQGFQEWQAEVNFLGTLSHPNLVKLLGYGWEDEVLFLVYELMQKGSLENHLFPRGSSVEPLPWDIRLQILIGAARGLAFLHSSDVKVIYRDFKTSNILLDGSYQAKLSDFGLAKMGPTAFSTHVSTRVMGTYGYAAPEYIATGHLYVKSDVYSFGVVLVEMLTGLRALDAKRPSQKQYLVDWIKPHLFDGRKLKRVIDARLEGTYPSQSAPEMARLALTCLEVDPKKRPSMQEVVETLERMDVAVEKNRQPRVRFSHQATEQHL